MPDRSRCDRCNSAPVPPSAARIALETGPLTTWLWTALTAEGLPVVCLEARHAKKALDMREQNRCQRCRRTGAFSACGLVSEVRVKGRSAMLAKALLGARRQLPSMSLALENQIRGILKTRNARNSTGPLTQEGKQRSRCNAVHHGLTA